MIEFIFHCIDPFYVVLLYSYGFSFHFIKRWSFPVQIQGVIHIGACRQSELRVIIGDGRYCGSSLPDLIPGIPGAGYWDPARIEPCHV